MDRLFARQKVSQDQCFSLSIWYMILQHYSIVFKGFNAECVLKYFRLNYFLVHFLYLIVF